MPLPLPLGLKVDQDPVHEYAQTGIFNVTLTVTRGDGAKKTMTAYDVLDTRKDTESPGLIHSLRQGMVKKGSFLSFVSADSTSSVTVNGISTQLPAGSVVKIRLTGHHRNQQYGRTSR